MRIFALSDAAIGALDGALAALPAPLRLALWGALAGALSMGLYALLSPQRRLVAIKDEVRAIRGRLTDYDGELAGALPLLRRQIALSLRHLGLTAVPALVAAAPMIALLVWAAGRFGDAVLLPGLPRWLAGWEAPLLGAALAASVAVKLRWRIH